MVATKSKTTPDRVALDFDEFANLFGRDRSWTYRMAKANKLKVITGYGKMMIPVSEVERITRGEVAP
jgi:hypothetical protein